MTFEWRMHHSADSKSWLASMNFMRLLAVSLLGVPAAIIIGIAVMALSAPIRPLLPPEGGATCFVTRPGISSPIPLTSSPRTKAPSELVEKIKVRLTRPPGQSPLHIGGGYGFDWRYAFSVTASLHGRGDYVFGRSNAASLSRPSYRCRASVIIGDGDVEVGAKLQIEHDPNVREDLEIMIASASDRSKAVNCTNASSCPGSMHRDRFSRA